MHTQDFISVKEYVKNQKEIFKGMDKEGITLHIFQVGDNPASNSYIKGKIKDCKEVGLNCELHKYPESVTEYSLIYDIKRDTEFNPKNKVILQLPVPNHIDPIFVLKNSISVKQDVDGFLPDSMYNPCTPAGIMAWLYCNKVKIEGKHCVVLGRSEIVGKPMARMLESDGGTVTVCHSHTPTFLLNSLCKNADIIVSAVGKENVLRCVVENNPIIIDVGINRDSNGKLCGDVDYSCMSSQGAYVTPVPGGVGLLTRLQLIRHCMFNLY